MVFYYKIVFFTDDQIVCPAPIAEPGVVIDDETPDIDDYNYGSQIRYSFPGLLILRKKSTFNSLLLYCNTNRFS